MADAEGTDEVSQLRDEVERLRSDNEKLARRGVWRARLRRAGLAFLLVLGCALFAASIVAIWTRITVLNTDQYVETMAPIAESRSVQDAVSDKLYTAITSKIDFQGLAREVLPERADLLAPAIESGIETRIRSELDGFVRSDRFPQLWNDANRRAHETVIGLLSTGKAGRLELEGDTVYLNLNAVVQRVKQRLSARGLDRVSAAIPASVDGRVTLLTSDGFEKARGAIHRLERLSIVLPILSVLCLLGYVILARPRRRAVLRVALGLTVTGLLLLAVLGIARTAYLDAINADVLPRQAAADIFDSLIVLLRTVLRIAVLAAIVVAILALLAGKPLRLAIEKSGPAMQSARERMAASPSTSWIAEHRAAVQWAIVLLGGLVLVAWSNPTAAVVLIDAALIALALWIVAALASGGRRAAP